MPRAEKELLLILENIHVAKYYRKKTKTNNAFAINVKIQKTI
jgi:hypothetical protein